MIKTSRHILNNANNGKIEYLDKLFDDYKSDLTIYIGYIIDGLLPLKNMLSSSVLPSEIIKHSKYKRDIYKKASEIIRSQIDKSKKRRYSTYKKVYSYFKENQRQPEFINKKFSELNLKDIKQTRYFTKPNLKNISINLTDELFNLKSGNHFDYFINLKLPYFNNKGTRSLQVNIPLNNHKQSNKLLSEGYTLRNNIQIKNINNKYYVNLIWFKELPIKKVNGKSMGIDMGYNKLIATSDNKTYNGNLSLIYNRISRKKQGSKSFKKLLIYRDNEINRICNELPLSEVNLLIMEDLKNVKKNKKYFNNKIQRWSYLKTMVKLENLCDEMGINMVKVSPFHTSQTCSSCGHTDKNNRNKELFLCVRCGYENDADINASINIHNKGVYSPFNQEKKLMEDFSI